MRIALDLDGVCYHWEKTGRYLLRTQRGCSHLIYPSTDWDYIKRMVDAEDWDWLWSEGVELGLFRYGHVITGAIEGVRELKARGHEVLVVTHRPSSAVQDTLDWLSYVRFEPAEVHILSDGRPKSSVPADIYIDDRPENIVEVLASTEADALLFDQPWNQDKYVQYDSHRFHRAKGWDQVLGNVTLIERRAAA